MQSETRSALVKMTADFYAFHADSFDQSRQNAWDSWNQVLKVVNERAILKSVLDLGCGNGRFAGFLSDNLPNIAYVGIDTSEQLIEKAKLRYPDFQFHVDSIENALTISEPSFQRGLGFDLAVSFGVFHHIPGKQYRQQLFQQLGSLLTPGGLLAISFWQPKLIKNFEQKTASDPGIADLEENDFLLGWEGDFSHLRYVHNFDDKEIEELIDHSALKLVDRFQGSGNDASNQIVILHAGE